MRLLRLIGRPVVVLLREWAISLAGVAIAAFALGWSSRR